MVAKLSAALSQLKNSIQLIKPDKLIISLSELEVTRLMSILNIRQSTDNNELKETLLNLTDVLGERLRLNSESQAVGQRVSYTPSPMLLSRQRQFRYHSDDDSLSSEPSVSRRLTRSNSVDTVMTSISQESNSFEDSVALLVKLKALRESNEELSAVNKLISTLDELSGNFSSSESSRLVFPGNGSQPSFFSSRGAIENNNRYGYGSMSSSQPLAETSFSLEVSH
jgi:hypothetical protein